MHMIIEFPVYDHDKKLKNLNPDWFLLVHR